MMSAFSAGLAEASERHERVAASARPLAIEVVDSIEAVETEWRVLERRASLTPYQRYDWIRAIIETGNLPAGRVAIAVIRDDSTPIAIVPLHITRSGFVARGRILGSEISNADWMIFDPAQAHRFTPDAIRTIFSGIARAAGPLDIVTLHAMPRQWLGNANPLIALGTHPAPDHFYIAELDISENGRVNAKRMRNIKRGKRRLEEAIGPVRLAIADTPEMIRIVHHEFLRQRALRFEQMGVHNVFAEPGFVRFFEKAAINSLGEERPALRMHALYAGDEIVATSIGTYGCNHYSQYINSTTDGPAAKYSLMGLLMVELIEELLAERISSIDMGLGDFDYKTDWTDPQPSFDAVVPVTPRGAIAAPVVVGLRQIKRTVKQQPILWSIAKATRRLLTRGRAET